MPSTVHAQNFNRDVVVNEPNFSNVGSELAGVHRIQQTLTRIDAAVQRIQSGGTNFIPQLSSRAGLVVPEKKKEVSSGGITK